MWSGSMSKLLCYLIILVSLNVLGQSEVLSGKNDKKLVGYWKGAEYDKITLVPKKYWTINREENGKYFIVFTSTKDCEVRVWNERGRWWINNGKFYKLNSRTGDLTVINYSFSGINEIFFSEKPSDAKIEDKDVFYFENLIDY
jgi:hypothetical protein